MGGDELGGYTVTLSAAEVQLVLGCLRSLNKITVGHDESHRLANEIETYLDLNYLK